MNTPGSNTVTRIASTANSPPLPRQMAPPHAAAPKRGAAATLNAGTAPRFGFKKIEPALAHRIGIYGSGGVGKTSLATSGPGPVAIFDFDDSLPCLMPRLSSQDIRVVSGVHEWG